MADEHKGECAARRARPGAIPEGLTKILAGMCSRMSLSSLTWPTHDVRALVATSPPVSSARECPTLAVGRPAALTTGSNASPNLCRHWIGQDVTAESM